MTAHNKMLLDIYQIKDIKPEIIPHFSYYADQYEPELLADVLFFEIDAGRDGSRGLDNYFIDILTANDWTITEYFLLSKFYLTKAL